MEMRKFLLVLFLVSSFVFASRDARKDFLNSYYTGDYQKAHDLLPGAFSDSLKIRIWDDRIHQHKKILNCKLADSSTHASLGIALMQIGHPAKAKEQFGSDWLSLLGLSTLALWENDFSASRKFIDQALAIAPERPEIQFSAGNLAINQDQAIDYFKTYLKQNSDDPLKRISAWHAIEFINKTRGRIHLADDYLPVPLRPLDIAVDYQAWLVAG